jgi:hypothetical protein
LQVAPPKDYTGRIKHSRVENRWLECINNKVEGALTLKDALDKFTVSTAVSGGWKEISSLGRNTEVG